MERDATYQGRLPELSDERLEELTQRIKPLVHRDGKLFHIEPVHPRRTSFTWDPQITDQAIGYEPIQDIPTYHTWGYYGFFKPTVAEVLSCIPADVIDEVAGIEMIGGGELTSDEALQHGTARLYRCNEQLAEAHARVVAEAGRLSTAQLAKQIAASPEQIDTDNMSQPGLSRFLKKCRANVEAVSQVSLPTEGGRLHVHCVDRSSYDDRRSYFNEFRVVFTDDTGYMTYLGRITSDDYSRGVAEAYISGSKTEPISPADPRWDPIVGTIGRVLEVAKQLNPEAADEIEWL